MKIDIKVKTSKDLHSMFTNEIKINGKQYTDKIYNVGLEVGRNKIPIVSLKVIPDELNIITEDIPIKFDLNSYTTKQLKQELSRRRKHDR